MQRPRESWDDLTIFQKVEIMQGLASYPAMTAMLFLRRGMGHRFLSPVGIFVTAFAIFLVAEFAPGSEQALGAIDQDRDDDDIGQRVAQPAISTRHSRATERPARPKNPCLPAIETIVEPPRPLSPCIRTGSGCDHIGPQLPRTESVRTELGNPRHPGPPDPG